LESAPGDKPDLKGFKVTCLKCGSENVSISGRDYGDDGDSYELTCWDCGSNYEAFFGEYTEGSK
jgi:transcription elongation factor Elf1